MANTNTKNLGQIAAIWISSNAPTNQKLIWYDTAERIHKVYDTYLGEWVSINPQVVTSTDIASLKNIAVNSGLSIGKFFYLTDVGTLAIAITTTKIWYVDSQNNYVVNDLATTITAYINSENLLIDGSTGIWNNATGKLEINFSEIASGVNIQSENDYVVMRRKNGTAWNWVKAKLSGFISAVSGNSISWNSGIFFDFNNAIASIKDRSSGIVSYELHANDIDALIRQFQNFEIENQQILNQAKSYTDQETSESALLDKQIGRPITIYANPPNVPGTGSKIADIIDIIFSWISVLQNSNRIKIGSGFSYTGRSGNVNYSDTVRSAIEKLIYKINTQSFANGISLPTNFNTNGRSGDFSAYEKLNVLLEKIVYQIKNTVCDIRKYMTTGAVLPKSKIYVYGIYPLECKATRISDDELPTLVFGNYSNQREEFFPHPTMIHIYTMLDESNDYTYSTTYNWDEAPAVYQELFNPTPHIPSDFYIGDFDADLPTPDESIFKSIGKLAKLVSSIDNFKLPNNFNPNSYSGIPAASDSLTTAIGKLSNTTKNFDKRIWESTFRNENWSSLVNLGDVIGEFDSQGRALYSASLEGAVYLLSSWYKNHFTHVSNVWTNINAYYNIGSGDGRAEQSKTCQYKICENALSLRCLSVTSIFTKKGNESYNILVDNNIDDITMTFKNIPQWAMNALYKKHGANNPFTLGISVVASDIADEPNFVAHGMMYGVIVEAPQDSAIDRYLKLIPYWTDFIKFKSVSKSNLQAVDDYISVLDKQLCNINGNFGSDWLSSYMIPVVWTGSISPFRIDIPLY